MVSVYYKQIRGLIGQKKKLKAQLSRSVTSTKMSRELEKQIFQWDKLIDSQISDFNVNIIKSSIGKGGVTDRQSFWELKSLSHQGPKRYLVPYLRNNY